MEKTESILPGLARFRWAALIVGVAGFALLAVGRSGGLNVFQSYLFGFVAWSVLTLGCLAFTILIHLVRARWGFPIVRIVEAGARVMPLLALLFVPLLFFLPEIYPWARPDEVARSEVLQHKAPLLNPSAFAVRAVIYFGFWTVVAYVLTKWSREEDSNGDPHLGVKRMNLAAPAAVFFVLTVTVAVTDWVMSLEEHWYSTIFGLLFIAGGALMALAMSIMLLYVLSKRRPYSDLLTAQNWHDLGNLLFTLVVFWAYLAFSQFLIIWSGNLPEEITYYADRGEGPWIGFGSAVMLLHFLLPFFILLSVRVKRTPAMLAGVALFIFIMRIAEMMWAVMPSLQRTASQVLWTDFAAFIGIGGLWIAFFGWHLQRAQLLPVFSVRREGVPEHA